MSIRLPQKPYPSRRAHGCRRQYHRPFGVVSKCALRDKREAPRLPGAHKNHRIALNTSHKNSSNCSKVICVVCGKASPKLHPPGSIAVSVPCVLSRDFASRLPPVGASPATISFRFRSYKNPFCQSWRGRKKAACEIFSHKPPLASFIMLFSFPVLRWDGFPAILTRPLPLFLLCCVLSASCG